MQIFVAACDNDPPIVETIDKICVVAGQNVNFEVTGTDIDSTDVILLTALGAPLTAEFSPATFMAPTDWLPSPVTGTFNWNTACEHISNQPYTVVFKATDSLTTPQLSDLHTVSIKVVGPSPEDLQASAALGNIELRLGKTLRLRGSGQQLFPRIFGVAPGRKQSFCA